MAGGCSMTTEIIASLRRNVVVGVDGSRPALGAARWAAREALRRGGELHLVFVLPTPIVRPGWSHARAREGLVGAAREDLADAARAAAEAAPGLGVSRRVRFGATVPVLAAESEWAGLLVLGTHGRGRVAAAFRFPVLPALAAATRAPLVVLRRDVEPVDRAGAPVLLLTGPTRAAAAARRFAETRGAPLVVADGTRSSRTDGLAMIVVGADVHGRRLDAATGPVVRRLLRTAPCPVAVVRDLPAWAP